MYPNNGKRRLFFTQTSFIELPGFGYYFTTPAQQRLIDDRLIHAFLITGT